MSEGRQLFTVEDSFTIHGRGIAILPGLVAQGDEVFRVGDPLELRRPDGSVIRTHIAGLPILSRPPSLTHVPVLLPGQLTKDDVPLGTEVWSADSTMVLRSPEEGNGPELLGPFQERDISIRDALNRQIRRVLGIFFTGLGVVPLSVLAGATIGGGTASVMVITAVGLSFGAMLYGALGGIRCPCCRGNWGFVLGMLGYPYARGPRMSVPSSIRFCPFCGTALDSECRDGGGPRDRD